MFVYSPRSDEIFSKSQTASTLTMFSLLEDLQFNVNTWFEHRLFSFYDFSFCLEFDYIF